MSLKHHGRFVVTTLLTVLAFLSGVAGDSLDTNKKTIYGRVVEIDDNGVSLKEGCSTQTTRVSWREIAYVAFNEGCTQPSPSNSGGGPIGWGPPTCAKQMVYIIEYKDESLFADHVFLDGATFRIDVVNNGGRLSGDASQVRKVLGLYRREVCLDKIPKAFQTPDGLRLSY